MLQSIFIVATVLAPGGMTNGNVPAPPETVSAPVSTPVSEDSSSRWWGRPPIGFLAFSGYYDTRKALRLTGQALALLPYGFDYFGFVDYDNAYAAPDLGEFDHYYGEQNLMWGPKGWGVDLHAQWALGAGVSGDIPDAIRGGLRWRIDAIPAASNWFHRHHILARLTYFPLVIRPGGDQVPGFHSQISANYRWEIAPDAIDRRVYLSGWIDVDTYSKGGDTFRVLTEHQVGIRVAGTFYAIAEFRHLYLDKFARGGEETGVGLGLEYQIPFVLPTAR